MLIQNAHLGLSKNNKLKLHQEETLTKRQIRFSIKELMHKKVNVLIKFTI